jgi:hypothetical protein
VSRVPLVSDDAGTVRARISAPGICTDRPDVTSLGARVHLGGAVDSSPWTRYGAHALPAEDVRDAAHGVVHIRHIPSCE